jgi:hypothetical protein
MTDRELLELAAKAVNGGSWHPMTHDTPNGRDWNPLTDDGDALRLAVKLNMTVKTTDYGGAAKTSGEWLLVAETDTLAATRRAIVRAAAEIGKELP